MKEKSQRIRMGFIKRHSKAGNKIAEAEKLIANKFRVYSTATVVVFELVFNYERPL